MSGYKLRVLVLLLIAAVSPILLHITDPFAFESWSQYAKNWNEIFLDMTLISVGLLFWDKASHYADQSKLMFKLPKWLFSVNIRERHYDRFIALFFFAILLTDVVEAYLAPYHMIVTGMGILLILTRMWLENVRIYRILATLGVVGFLLGFLTPLYRTFEGEYIVLVVASAYMLDMNSKE